MSSVLKFSLIVTKGLSLYRIKLASNFASRGSPKGHPKVLPSTLFNPTAFRSIEPTMSICGFAHANTSLNNRLIRTICCIYPKTINSSTPRSDQDRISPYNINTMSRRRVIRIKENISWASISWSNTKLSGNLGGLAKKRGKKQGLVLTVKRSYWNSMEVQLNCCLKLSLIQSLLYSDVTTSYKHDFIQNW